MTSPIKAIGEALSPAYLLSQTGDKIGSFLGKTFSKATPAIPDPALPPPAQLPSGNKPGKKGMQSSFLSGVAGGAAQQGSATGKSLLGA